MGGRGEDDGRALARDGRLGLRAGARVARHRHVRASATASSSAARGRAAVADVVHDDLPATEQPLAEVARGGRAGRRRAVDAAREAFDGRGAHDAGRERGEVPVPHRAGPSGARPRVRRRGVARRRQADQGVARRRRPARRGALLLPRRLGGQARLRLPRPRGRAARRRRPDHPVELPAAHGGVEDRARARVRQHRRAQARRDDAAHRAAARRRSAGGGAAARRREHRHGRRATGRAPRARTTGIDKVAFTGSTEVGKAIQRELAGTGKRLTLELGGKAANIVFDDAPLDQAVEGIVNGIYFNQGHVCCAGSRLLVQESIHDQLVRKLSGGMATLRRRRSARQEHRHRRHQLEGAARADPRARRRAARRKAPSSTSRRAGSPRRASGSRRRSSRARAEPPDRTGGDLRPGAQRADVPHSGRGRREGQQHPVRPLGRHLDREGLAHPLDGDAAEGRRRLGAIRSTASTRRRRSAATRSPGFGREGGRQGSRRT